VSRIADGSVDAVKVAVDMVDLVSGRTQLKRQGRRYVGRCPFHDERTASFGIDPLDKLYYCFGCQRGGDAIGFVMEAEALDFTAAVEWLADRYGVRVEYETTSPDADRRREQRDRLLKLLDDTAAFYERFLWEAGEAKGARDYLQEREISEETARRFRLGYAPSAGDRLRRAALGKGFTPAELD
jgi:DNA primase